MEEKINTTKIIVTGNHEITDLVRDIHKSKAERIVLTFTEQSDLLISPINLRVLEETAERESKLLIAQIIQNPTGIRNAKLAGIKVIDTPSTPTESDWEEAFELITKRKEERKEKKKIVEEKPQEINQKEEFEERIKSQIDEKKNIVDRRGIRPTSSFISIDEDIPQKDIPREKLLPNKDFTSVDAIKSVRRERVSIFQKLKGINKKNFLKKSLLILLPLLLIIVVSGLLYDHFATFVKVKIFVEAKPVEIEMILTGEEGIEEIDLENLKVPIKKEEISKSLSNSITATGKAFKGEKAKGSIRLIFYYKEPSCPDTNPPKVVLNAGHVVTTGDLSYKLTSGVEIGCNEMVDAQVEAADIGDQYNISASKNFIIDSYTIGYSEGEVKANNSAAFTGGSREEYTVLSQQDVNNAVEQLSTTAIEEVKSELRENAKDWEIIEDTILSAVDAKSIKTDKSVGAEADTANLDLTIKGSATYYLTTNLTDILTEALRKKAEEENLFESDKDNELVLGDEIKKSISIEDSEKDVVKIKILAKSNIKPKVEKTELENALKGKKWDEGKNYINSLNYAERKAEVTFSPSNYPAFLKRFPERRGGVMVSISELEVKE